MNRPSGKRVCDRDTWWYALCS